MLGRYSVAQPTEVAEDALFIGIYSHLILV